MSDRAYELAMRHGALRARIAQQRADLAQNAWPLVGACAAVDRGRAGVDWVRRHPVAVGATAAALVVAKPRRAWRWAQRGLVLWRGWQAVKSRLLHRD